MNKFTAAYIECALWSSTDDNDDPLDVNHSVNDLAPETLTEIIADCKRFQEENAADIATGSDGPGYDRYERAGHNFWLTRNHHGAGFWDGDYTEEVGERLTAASHAYGESNLCIGDDGLIYAN